MKHIKRINIEVRGIEASVRELCLNVLLLMYQGSTGKISKEQRNGGPFTEKRETRDELSYGTQRQTKLQQTDANEQLTPQYNV